MADVKSAKNTKTKESKTDQILQIEVSSTDFGRDFKWDRLEGTVESLISDSQYWEAATKLEGILPEQTGYNRLKAQLMMAECFCQLGKGMKTARVIEGIRRDIMASSTKPGDVRERVKQYSMYSFHIRAIALLQCASKKYVRDASPDDAVAEIGQCVREGCNILNAMAEKTGHMATIASNFAIHAMEDMLDDLREINGANPETKVVGEAECLNLIGFSYYKFWQYSDEITFYQKGIQIMKSQFGLNASEYNVYAKLLHNMGSVNESLENFYQAWLFYSQSFEAYKNTKDWPSEEVKQNYLQTTSHCLEKYRRWDNQPNFQRIY